MAGISSDSWGREGDAISRKVNYKWCGSGEAWSHGDFLKYCPTLQYALFLSQLENDLLLFITNNNKLFLRWKPCYHIRWKIYSWTIVRHLPAGARFKSIQVSTQLSKTALCSVLIQVWGWGVESEVGNPTSLDYLIFLGCKSDILKKDMLTWHYVKWDIF